MSSPQELLARMDRFEVLLGLRLLHGLLRQCPGLVLRAARYGFDRLLQIFVSNAQVCAIM